MEKYCIRPDYISRTTTAFKDMCSRPSIYQRKVYEIARHIAIRHNLQTVLDFGCGSAEKLLEFFPEFGTIGVDLEPTVRQLRQRHPQRKWLTPEAASTTREVDLVICADVIEHVLDPDEIIVAVQQINPKFVVFSTPDRDYFVNTKNHSPVGPPQSEFHIREWSFTEFKSYLSQFFEMVCHTRFDNVDHLGQVAVCRPRNKYNHDFSECGEIYVVGDFKGKMTDDFLSIAKPLFDRARLKLHRYKDCRQFAEAIDAGNIDRDAPCTVVMVYSEEKGHLEAGKIIQDICDTKLRRCRLIHPFSLGKILGNKIETNRVLSAAGVRCPKLIESQYHDKLVFQNAPDNTQSPVCLIAPGHELNPSMYNTEFIDTRYRFGNEVYYCSIRALCVGGVMTSLFLRFRSVSEKSCSVHTRDTPLLSELINQYYQERVAPVLGDLKNICKKIGNVLGLGFYVHDLALCTRTNELYVLESGFKFHERTWADHIATISDKIIIDGNHYDIISKAASEFVEQIKPNNNVIKNTRISAAKPPSETVTVIIRSVGERTERLCYERLVHQVSADNIHIVRNKTPFTEALRETYAVALRENRKWTLTIDADVLILPQAVDMLIAFAEAQEERFFSVVGMINDKFLASPRVGGVRVYRTALLKQAIELIPDSLSAIRPEYHVLQQMQDKGYPYLKTDILAGLHDFEQYYRDIYRKCFIHAKKHQKDVMCHISHWRQMARRDPDFCVAAAGFKAGLKYCGQSSIDVNASYLGGVDDVMRRLGLSEKAALPANTTRIETPSEKREPMHRGLTPSVSAGICSQPGRKHREKRIALIVSIPERAKEVRYVLGRIYPQVDEIRLLLNGYDRIPEGLKACPKLSRIQISPKGEMFASGVWTLLHSEDEGYVFVLDDDIIYPTDYVATLIDKIERYGRKAAVAVHGTNYRRPFEDSIKDRVVYHFMQAHPADSRIHCGGVGTLAFHTHTIRPEIKDFPNPNFRDLWFAILAMRKKVPIVCVARPQGWLRQIKIRGSSIWRMSHEPQWRKQKNEVLVRHLVPLIENCQYQIGLATETNEESSKLDPIPSAIGMSHTHSHQKAGRPKVSVVMACRNEEPYLAECLDSMLAQTLTEWELLAVDDGSTDRTREILEHYADRDSRVRLWYYDDSKGPYMRRNFAITQSRSPFICIQDADDVMEPEKLAVLYEHISRDERLGIVGSWYRRFLDYMPGEEFGDRVELPTGHEQMLQRNARTIDMCWHGSAIIRKSLFDVIGLYDEHPWGSDSFWLFKAGLYSLLTQNVRFMNVSQCLTLRRHHLDSQTGSINSLDPRSRRRHLARYYLEKLIGIERAFRENPGMDVAAHIRNCTVSDFIPRFGHLFTRWESAPVTTEMLDELIAKSVRRFEDNAYIYALLSLNVLEQIDGAIGRKWLDFHVFRALAWYAAGHDGQAAREIERFPNNRKDCFLFDFSVSSAVERKRRVAAFYRSWRGAPSACLPVAPALQSAVSKSGPPTASVIMPAYNSERYIREAIDSVLAQSFDDFELIIVDDGSTDQTVSIIQSYRDSRIRLLHQAHQYTGAATNRAIKAARGEFILGVDSDDKIEPDYLRQLMSVARDCPGYDYYYPQVFKLMDVQGRPLSPPWNYKDFGDGQTLPAFMFMNAFLPIPHPGSLKRRTMFERTGLYREQKNLIDFEFMTRNALKIRFKWAPSAAGYCYRLRDNSISHNWQRRNKNTALAMEAMLTQYAPEQLCPTLAQVAPDKRQGVLLRYAIGIFTMHARKHDGQGGHYFHQAAQRLWRQAIIQGHLQKSCRQGRDANDAALDRTTAQTTSL